MDVPSSYFDMGESVFDKASTVDVRKSWWEVVGGPAAMLAWEASGIPEGKAREGMKLTRSYRSS